MIEQTKDKTVTNGQRSDTIALQAQQLGKSFQTVDGELTVLKNLNLTVTQSEMVAVVGESGVGKSTLLHLLGGLDKPSEGKIFCDSQDVAALSEDGRAVFRNRHIGFVFQFHHLLEDFTALENVVMPALAAGKDYKAAERSALELFEAVGLSARKNHLPAQLSGGEQQRVAMARALVNRPRVLLADEPTGNLDTATGERLFDLLVTINREFGGAFVIATHNMALAKRCDTVYKLERGALSQGS